MLTCVCMCVRVDILCFVDAVTGICLVSIDHYRSHYFVYIIIKVFYWLNSNTYINCVWEYGWKECEPHHHNGQRWMTSHTYPSLHQLILRGRENLMCDFFSSSSLSFSPPVPNVRKVGIVRGAECVFRAEWSACALQWMVHFSLSLLTFRGVVGAWRRLGQVKRRPGMKEFSLRNRKKGEKEG